MKKKTYECYKEQRFPGKCRYSLKELVSFLQLSGYKTTPSCSGHHRSEKNFEKVYDDLERIKEDIRNRFYNSKTLKREKFIRTGTAGISSPGREKFSGQGCDLPGKVECSASVMTVPGKKGSCNYKFRM
jgi:hypothetical protein